MGGQGYLATRRALLLVEPRNRSCIEEALAQPPLTGPGYTALTKCTGAHVCDRHFGFQCTSPINGDGVRANVEDLFATLTPCDPSVDRGDALWPPPTSLLDWGRYDLIVVQSCWPLKEDEWALSYAGAALAAKDAYERANSRTFKIVIELDAPDYELRAALDHKGLLGWVSLADEAAMGSLIAAATNYVGASFSRAYAQLEAKRYLKSPAEQLTGFVKRCANLMFVDDEAADLESAFHDVTGEVITVPRNASPLRMCSRAANSRGGTPRVAFFAGADAIIGELYKWRGEYTVLVTDLLFKTTRDFGGLELIQAVRAAGIPPSELGIVVRTAHDEASVVMAALRRGADLVVHKPSRSSRERRSGHRDLPSEPRDRLIAAIAEICLQKDYLRRARVALQGNTRRASRVAATIHSDLHRVFNAYPVVTSLGGELRGVMYDAYCVSHFGRSSFSLPRGTL